MSALQARAAVTAASARTGSRGATSLRTCCVILLTYLNLSLAYVGRAPVGRLPDFGLASAGSFFRFRACTLVAESSIQSPRPSVQAFCMIATGLIIIVKSRP
jgi:hypothetical protein